MNRWLLTGPTNGDISRFQDYKEDNFVILGNCGLVDPKILKKLESANNCFYCVRGLDKKATYLDDFEPKYDDDVQGLLWTNSKFPFIGFFEDGQIYTINGLKVLIIGGGTNLLEDEQLANKEKVFLDVGINNKERIEKHIKDKNLDLILTYSYPNKEVCGSFEEWLGNLSKTCNYRFWYVGREGEDIDISDKVKFISEDIIDFDSFKVVKQNYFSNI